MNIFTKTFKILKEADKEKKSAYREYIDNFDKQTIDEFGSQIDAAYYNGLKLKDTSYEAVKRKFEGKSYDDVYDSADKQITSRIYKKSQKDAMDPVKQANKKLIPPKMPKEPKHPKRANFPEGEIGDKRYFAAIRQYNEAKTAYQAEKMAFPRKEEEHKRYLAKIEPSRMAARAQIRRGINKKFKQELEKIQSELAMSARLIVGTIPASNFENAETIKTGIVGGKFEDITNAKNFTTDENKNKLLQMYNKFYNDGMKFLNSKELSDYLSNLNTEGYIKDLKDEFSKLKASYVRNIGNRGTSAPPFAFSMLGKYMFEASKRFYGLTGIFRREFDKDVSTGSPRELQAARELRLQDKLKYKIYQQDQVDTETRKVERALTPKEIENAKAALTRKLEMNQATLEKLREEYEKEESEQKKNTLERNMKYFKNVMDGIQKQIEKILENNTYDKIPLSDTEKKQKKEEIQKEIEKIEGQIEKLRSQAPKFLRAERINTDAMKKIFLNLFTADEKEKVHYQTETGKINIQRGKVQAEPGSAIHKLYSASNINPETPQGIIRLRNIAEIVFNDAGILEGSYYDEKSGQEVEREGGSKTIRKPEKNDFRYIYDKSKSDEANKKAEVETADERRSNYSDFLKLYNFMVDINKIIKKNEGQNRVKKEEGTASRGGLTIIPETSQEELTKYYQEHKEDVNYIKTVLIAIKKHGIVNLLKVAYGRGGTTTKQKEDLERKYDDSVSSLLNADKLKDAFKNTKDVEEKIERQQKEEAPEEEKINMVHDISRIRQELNNAIGKGQKIWYGQSFNYQKTRKVAPIFIGGSLDEDGKWSGGHIYFINWSQFAVSSGANTPIKDRIENAGGKKLAKGKNYDINDLFRKSHTKEEERQTEVKEAPKREIAKAADTGHSVNERLARAAAKREQEKEDSTKEDDAAKSMSDKIKENMTDDDKKEIHRQLSEKPDILKKAADTGHSVRERLARNKRK